MIEGSSIILSLRAPLFVDIPHSVIKALLHSANVSITAHYSKKCTSKVRVDHEAYKLGKTMGRGKRALSTGKFIGITMRAPSEETRTEIPRENLSAHNDQKEVSPVRAHISLMLY